jgi:type IV secretory pathway VirB9-like protein
MAPVPWELLVATGPDHPPEAVQEVAFVEDQVKVELPPGETLAGFAVSETVGGLETVTVAD